MSSIRSYVLLLVCLAVASGVVHKIQTQHHALSGEHSKHFFGHASLRHQKLYRRKVGMQASVGKLPTENDNYDYITGTITVGTPPQPFIVEVDAFFHNELILIGANTNLSRVEEDLPKKNTYNADNSSTYVAVSGNISTGGLIAHKAQDVLNIGLLSATIKSFIVTDNVPFPFDMFPVDGKLGLSPVKKSDDNVSVIADDLIDQLDKPIISVYINVSMEGQGNGQMTLGTEDTDNCQSTWSYVPALISIFDDVFTVHASSAEVTIGGQLTTVNLDSHVIFMPWMIFAVPDSAKDVLVNGTGATHNESIEHGIYTIDCNTTKAPLITLNIGGVGNSTDSTSRKLVLSGNDYIRYWERQDVCYLGITFDYSISEWYLGSQVLNNHCISYNYKERTIGFADSKNTMTNVPKTEDSHDVFEYYYN